MASMNLRWAWPKQASELVLVPSGLVRSRGNRTSWLTGVAGKRRRTSSCWSAMTWAVDSAIGSRLPGLLFLESV